MAKITNTAPRMLHLGGVMCPPGVETEVPDAALESQAVKDMIENGELATGAAAEKAAADIAKKAATADAQATKKP